MKKQIAPPSNWQDFEDWCKRIFGEMWNCKYDIKKHGRSGQPQSGVDVYGFPDCGTKLYGVQCKGKDNQLGKGLTETEIDEEIEKAKLFEPKLTAFFFATTAPKDVKIEKYILTKNIESVTAGSFRIGLYDWEDLADEIRRNRGLHSSYLADHRYEDEHSVLIECNGKAGSLIQPFKLLRTTTLYTTDKKLTNPEVPDWMKNMSNLNFGNTNIFQPENINHSWCKIKTTIFNDGQSAFDDWKLWLELDANIDSIQDDEKSGFGGVIVPGLNFRTTFVYEEDMRVLYSPLNNAPLVPRDGRSFTWWLLPKLESTETLIKWQLLSRNGTKEGEFRISFEPEYETASRIIKVEKVEEERPEYKTEYLIKKRSS